MKHRWPYLFLLIAAFFWGGNFTVGRSVLQELPPVTLALLRWVVALLVLLPFAYRDIRKNGRAYLAHWKEIAGMGLLGIAVFSVLVYMAIRHTSAINAALLSSWSPVMIVLVSYFLLGERITPRQVSGLAASTLGVLWIVSRGDWGQLASFTFNPGDLLMLASNLIWALYSILVRKTAGRVPGMTGFALSTAAGVLFLLPAAVWETAVTDVHTVSWHALSGVAYLGIFPSVVSFSCWNIAVQHLGPSKASPFLNLVPLAAAVFAVMFLGEHLHPAQVIGGMFILFGVYLSVERKAGVRISKKADAPSVREANA